MKKSLTFQQVIMRLEKFWTKQGCLIWQPSKEKGRDEARPSRERATLRVGLDGAFLYDYMSSLGLNDLSLTA